LAIERELAFEAIVIANRMGFVDRNRHPIHGVMSNETQRA
jgi:hypothetical protein